MAGMDKDKAIKGGVKAGIGLLALVAGRGGIEEASQGVNTILEAAGLVSATDDKAGKKEAASAEKPLTEEQKQDGIKMAAAAIAREAGAALKG